MRSGVQNFWLSAKAYILACICMSPVFAIGYAIQQFLNGNSLVETGDKISLDKLVEFSGTLFFLVGVLGFPALIVYMLCSSPLSAVKKLSVFVHAMLGGSLFCLNGMIVKDWMPSSDVEKIVPIFLSTGTLTGLIHGSLKYYLNVKEVTANA